MNRGGGRASKEASQGCRAVESVSRRSEGSLASGTAGMLNKRRIEKCHLGSGHLGFFGDLAKKKLGGVVHARLERGKE